MTPTLAMLGPIELAQFMDVLDPSRLPEKIPKGLGGSPVNLLSRELLSRGWHLLIVTVSPDVSEEVILEGENLKICVGPDRPKHARDFFAGERSYMLGVLRRGASGYCACPVDIRICFGGASKWITACHYGT